jgi:formamidopyrimidine-DNA glycosylase
MPELPEVETVRRGLAQVLEGRRFTRVVARRADLRRPLPADLSGRLQGRRVRAVDRRAKYLLFRLDDGMVLIVHLGMSGRIRIHRGDPPPPGRHDHVIFETDDGASIYFNDARRFGMMALASGNELPGHPLLAGLGPEPLDPAFDAERLAAALAGRRAPLKAALMDQRVVAGLGNIYVCESLFRAGLSPRRKAMTVTGIRAERLCAAIRSVISEAIDAGGSSLRDHRQPTGELGYFQHSFAVYGRTGQPCPGCDCARRPAKDGSTGIRHLVQSGRSTFYCATRQR